MRRAKPLAGIAAVVLLAAYVGSFAAAINVLGLSYIEGDCDPPLARGYYFASDPTTNRCLYYLYYPLAKLYGWAVDAVFLEHDPFASGQLIPRESGTPGTGFRIG